MLQREAEQDFVDRIRGGMSGLGEQGGGAGHQAGHELRRGDHEVREERDHDAALVPAALDGSKGGDRVSQWHRPSCGRSVDPRSDRLMRIGCRQRGTLPPWSKGYGPGGSTAAT